MRLQNAIADLPRNGGLLPLVVILYWDQKLLSAFMQLWMVLESMMSLYRAVGSTKVRLSSRDLRDEPVIVSLGRSLILAYKLKAKIGSNPRALRFELQVLGI